MKEAELNTIIRNTLKDGWGFGYKISDKGGGAQQRRPFDGMGLYQDRVIFWEAKQSRGVTAFNLKTLFEGERGHQMETFETLYQKRILTSEDTGGLWVIYGCSIPRAHRVYVFEYEVLRKLYRKSGITSIHKKTLETLPHATITKKRLVDIQVIRELEEIQNDA